MAGAVFVVAVAVSVVAVLLAAYQLYRRADYAPIRALPPAFREGRQMDAGDFKETLMHMFEDACRTQPGNERLATVKPSPVPLRFRK